jgi:predicted ester cyclase
VSGGSHSVHTGRKDRVVVAWAAAWDRGEVDALDALLSPDYRRRASPADPGQSLAEFKESITATRAAFPGLTTTIDEIVAEGDRLAVRWHSLGRHEGPFLGVPPTQREVAVEGATFARFEGELVAEEFVTWNPRALLTALGIITVGEDR